MQEAAAYIAAKKKFIGQRKDLYGCFTVPWSLSVAIDSTMGGRCVEPFSVSECINEIFKYIQLEAGGEISGKGKLSRNTWSIACACARDS